MLRRLGEAQNKMMMFVEFLKLFCLSHNISILNYNLIHAKSHLNTRGRQRTDSMHQLADSLGKQRMSNTAELQRLQESQSQKFQSSPVIVVPLLALLAATSHLAFVFGLSSWADFD